MVLFYAESNIFQETYEIKWCWVLYLPSIHCSTTHDMLNV